MIKMKPVNNNISIRNRKLAGKSFMSSHVPMTIMTVAATSPQASVVLGMSACSSSPPIRMPE